MIYLKGIPLYFRKLDYDDIKCSYYNLMGLLSQHNVNLINTLTNIDFNSNTSFMDGDTNPFNTDFMQTATSASNDFFNNNSN